MFPDLLTAHYFTNCYFYRIDGMDRFRQIITSVHTEHHCTRP